MSIKKRFLTKRKGFSWLCKFFFQRLVGMAFFSKKKYIVVQITQNGYNH